MKQWIRQDYIVVDGGIGLYDLGSRDLANNSYKTGFLYTKYKSQTGYTDLYYYDSGKSAELQITEDGQLKIPNVGSSDKIISTDNDKQLQISTTGLLTLTDLPSTELARFDFTKTYSVIIGRNAGLNLHSASAGDVIIGTNAYSISTGSPSLLVAIGYNVASLSTGTSGRNCVLIGYECASYSNNLEDNVFIGYRSGYQFNSIGDTGYRNVFIGREAANSMRNGWSNVLIGYQAGYGNYSYGNIQYNIGIGDSALYSCYGSYNIGLGCRALYNASSGAQYNIAIGHNAFGGISYQTTGSHNIGIGMEALRDVTTGSYNISIGAYTMRGITTSSNNICIGYSSGISMYTGSNNIGIGTNALYAMSSGNNNIAIGSSSGYTLSTQSDNSFLGYNAGLYITGSQNTFIGSQSGYGVSSTGTRSDNTAVGFKSLYAIQSSASNNTAIGSSAGIALTTGSNNLLIGKSAGASITTGSNNIIIGQVPASTTSERYFAIGYHPSNNPILRGVMYDGSGTDSYLRICADKIYLNSGGDSTGIYLYNGKIGLIHENPDVEVGGATFNIQGSGKAITIKGKYVAHGLTSVMDTDTVMALYFKDQTYGSAEIWGVGADTSASNSSPGIKIKGYSKYCDTTDASNLKRSCVEIDCAKINGPDVSSWDATNLIFSVRNNGSSVFFVGGDGKLYSDGSSSVILFDDHEDIKLVQSFSNPQNNPYYEKLKEIGVITNNNMFCHNNAMMLAIGAIGQLFNVIRGIAEKLNMSEEELYQLAINYKK